jgi:uncharacterized repeat protein (TIGR03803 family)
MKSMNSSVRTIASRLLRRFVSASASSTACIILGFCATAAIAAPAQTFTVNKNAGATAVGKSLGVPAQPPSSLGINAINVGSAAGASSVELIANAATNWQASSNVTWLHVAAANASGSGSALIQFTYDANPNATVRTGTLTIAGLTLTVTQAGTNLTPVISVKTLVSSGLVSPQQIATDASGNIYIASAGANAIAEWNASTQQLTTLVSGFNDPIGVAFGFGNVFIADTLNQDVDVWNANDGLLIMVNSGLNNPTGLAVDSSANVYIADSLNNAIEERQASTLEVVTLLSGLNDPFSVAVDGLQNVYIADSGNSAIKRLNPATGDVTALVSSGLSDPTGIAVDGQGNVYFSDSGDKVIDVWSPATGQTTQITTTGKRADGVAVDQRGNVYFSESLNADIREINFSYLPLAVMEGPFAGSDSVQVLTTAPVLTATSDQSWLTITGIGNGTIAFSFQGNTSSTSRTAHISVLGQQITVTQGADTALLTPASLAFGNQNIGTASTARSLTLSNTSTAALTISSIAVTGANAGDFSESNTCGSSVAAGGKCTISVKFTPKANGARSADVTVTDNATASPQTASLTGTGVPAFPTLSNFDFTNGANPNGALVQGTDGKFYGTANGGGTNDNGVIFTVTPAGNLNTLYNFCSQTNCTDGSSPLAGLVQGTDGSFYGTTEYGGANTANGEPGGTVFKITTAGELTTLYSFCALANCADGSYLMAGVIEGTDGNFYGTTSQGGANNRGTIFKMTRAGKLTTLYSFCSQINCSDGSFPWAGLLQATDGNLYGTTLQGIPQAGVISGGTVFKITTAGTFTTLYTFCSQANCTDGAGSKAGLVQAADGNLYGTTNIGGDNAFCPFGCGTLFKITTAGELTTLYDFCSQASCDDGANPQATLVQGTDGNFYGVTEIGGTNNAGTTFAISPAGTLTTLSNFASANGISPEAQGLIQATNGSFYGTTDIGGTGSCGNVGCGTVFGLNVGLGRFVEPQTTSGKVGATVVILGTNLTGSTAVSFNGTAAAFTVVSSSEIKATVPAGATTGTVKVTPLTGTLSSNVAFRVTPQITSFTPSSGTVGTVVQITGVSLTQATEVTFNGVAATDLTVNSGTEVTATVPTGTTTGKIAITTKGGTVTSAANFDVTE